MSGSRDRFLSLAEVAKQLGRDPRTVRRWIHEGWLRPVRPKERAVGVLESELRRALRRRQRRR